MFSLLTHNQLSLSKERITVAVASNFKSTLEHLAPIFERQHNIELTIVSAATIILFNQINYGAPYDIFLSADEKHPRLLEANRKAVKGQRFTYAQGQLALASNTTPLKTLSSDELRTALQQSSGSIAIAKPTLAPYGIASKQALSYINLWQILQDQLVQAQNVNQSFQWFYSGTVEFAFIATSQLKQSDVKHYQTLPSHWYQPIEQQATLLQQAAANKHAKQFLSFLKSTQARDVIKQHGYVLPESLIETVAEPS